MAGNASWVATAWLYRLCTIMIVMIRNSNSKFAKKQDADDADHADSRGFYSDLSAPIR
jgi:hypothetical protein